MHGLAAWERRHHLRAFGLDILAAVAAVVGALVGRDALLGSHAVLDDPSTPLRGALLVAAWPLLLARHGGYASRYVGAGTEEYRAVTRAALALVALVAFMSYALKLEFSRGVLLLAVPVMAGATLVLRWMLRRRLAAARERGRFLRPTVLVGEAHAVRDVLQRIGADPRTTGMRVSGVCVSDPHDPVLASDEFVGVPVLGDEASAVEAVERVGAEAVAVASSPTMSGHALRRLGWALEQRDVDLLVAPGVVEVAGPRLTMRRAAGLPLLHVERPVLSGIRYGLKLAGDRVLAATALLVMSPLFLLVALLVRLDSRGPAFFRQDRVGEGGRMFSMLKFRTMVPDAEARLEQMREGHDGNAVLFKRRKDPRVTRVGAFLRRFSIDELPQLFNVVRGEMSLVGPRPPLTREVDEYENDVVRRLRVRPGMTGLWQVSGRSDLSWVDSVRLDLWYVDNWSLALDAQILLRTAKAVLRGQGAY
ncbi:sugar transferase [Phycicoccus sp. CSK15P-2]|uniref:sugar transferase n=1 Tax=Phycicoccus sp. CSK15P-2 TaxID=2807627 RepID=UPI0027DB56E4|nr:sugar transferase [Phycicoccus sp. CSK15P-2]